MGKDAILELIKILDGKLTHAAVTCLGDRELVRMAELLHHWHELVMGEVSVRQAQQFDDDAQRGPQRLRGSRQDRRRQADRGDGS